MSTEEKVALVASVWEEQMAYGWAVGPRPNTALALAAWERARQIALLEHVFPVAWQHINFHGRFEFRSSPEQIDIKAMVQELARFPIQSIPVP